MNAILIFWLSIGFLTLSISVFILKKIIEEQKQSLVNLHNFIKKIQKQSEEKSANEIENIRQTFEKITKSQAKRIKILEEKNGIKKPKIFENSENIF